MQHERAARQAGSFAFGGSVAARVLHCPASVGLIEKVPANLRRSSAYADRGTALHAAMALLLGDDPPTLESLVGKTFNGYTITLTTSRTLCGRFMPTWRRSSIRPGLSIYLEHRVVFPTIAGAFGTVDLIVRIGNTITSSTSSSAPACASSRFIPRRRRRMSSTRSSCSMPRPRATRLPEFFAGVENIVLTILQPQSIEPDAEMVSSVTITHAELDEFIAVYRAACEEALSQAPRLERGPWCRFCPAKPICPEHTGPLLDLAQFMMPAPATHAVERSLLAGARRTAWTSSMRSRTSARRCMIRPSAPWRAAISARLRSSRPAAPSAIGAMMNLLR